MLKRTVEKIIRGFADNKSHTLSINCLRFQPEEAEFLEDCLLIKPLRDCNSNGRTHHFIDYEMIDQIDVHATREKKEEAEERKKDFVSSSEEEAWGPKITPPPKKKAIPCRTKEQILADDAIDF